MTPVVKRETRLIDSPRSPWRRWWSDLGKGLRRRSAHLRRLPDFLIIGAQKCGTSSLYHYLAQHPEVRRASRKEVHFFDSEYYERGLRWYRAHFPLAAHGTVPRWRGGGDSFVTGEASPYYVIHPHAPRRVLEVLPEAKLIAILRNPIERAISHYNHQRQRGREPLDLEQALIAESKRLDGEFDRMLEHPNYYSYSFWAYSYLARGRYAEQLRRWFDVFPRERMLILGSEEFFGNTTATMDRVHDFLGLSRFRLNGYRSVNAGRYGAYRPSDSARHYLIEYFRPHSAELYDLLGRDFGWTA